MIRYVIENPKWKIVSCQERKRSASFRRFQVVSGLRVATLHANRTQKVRCLILFELISRVHLITFAKFNKAGI